MKRRLTLSILGTVVATLILAGVGTLLFSLIGATKATENDLRSQAEATAELIDASRTARAQLSSDLTQRLAAQLCRAPQSTPPDSEATALLSNLRDLLCNGQAGSVEAATAWLCDGGGNRLDRLMTAREAELRRQFCADPSEQTLAALRDNFCASTPRPTTPAIRRQLQQLRTLICSSSARRSQQQAQVEQTLTKQSIDLVIVGPDDRIEPQTLTLDIPAERLDVSRLRAGETVSGRVDGRVFAAAPINPSDERMGVILIDRNANPLRDSVQWFLMASGVTLLIGAIVATRLGQALTSRLRNATEATARIAAGDLTTRLPEHSRHDELDDLARSINTMAEELERAQGLERQFLLSISHDLRTPLTSIRGYAEAIADGTAPDPARAAGVILAESRRLERLVQDLLDLAKLESRHFTLTIEPVDLTTLVAQSADGFRREAEEAGLQIVVEIPPGTHVFALGDADRLQQVLANLVENALKFATSTITVAVRDSTAGPLIEVSDDGPGIADADLPHVFERLYVAQHEPKRREAGSGLGLAIVRELVDAMGGSVRATARPTGGTTFVVVLRR